MILKGEVIAVGAYVRFGDVQQFLTNHLGRYSKKATFVQAIQALGDGGKVFPAAAEAPDFSQWAVEDAEHLKRIYGSLAIDVFNILMEPDAFNTHVTEEFFGFSARDVNAFLHLQDELGVSHTHDYYEISYVIKGSLDLRCASDRRLMK